MNDSYDIFISDAELRRSLAEVLGDPAKHRILTALVNMPEASVREMAERIGEPEGKTRYHLDAMRGLGLLRLTGERARRGTVEKFYRLAGRPVLWEQDFELLDRRAKAGVVTGILKAIFIDATRAIRARTFDKRLDRVIVHAPVALDAQGWDEAIAAHLEAFHRVERINEQCRERLAASGEAPIRAVSGQLMFEVPSVEH